MQCRLCNLGRVDDDDAAQSWPSVPVLLLHASSTLPLAIVSRLALLSQSISRVLKRVLRPDNSSTTALPQQLPLAMALPPTKYARGNATEHSETIIDASGLATQHSEEDKPPTTHPHYSSRRRRRNVVVHATTTICSTLCKVRSWALLQSMASVRAILLQLYAERFM